MRTPTAVLAGALVAAVASSAGVALASRPAPPPCAVAVVDLARAYNEHTRAKKLNENLQAQDDALKARLQAEETKARKEIQDLEVRFAAGSEEFEKGRREILLKYAPIEYDLKRDQERLVRSQLQGMAAAYKEILTEVERIATERGYTCAVNFDPEPIVTELDGKILRADAVRKQMIDRTTLWAAPSVDITKDVIEALSKK
ncbi:MAG TPA: OmpH family outer membrane protein [Planctomycetota bacterium]|nr:OmpH family outer membrane protein [Planctomycetota bacterium]